MVKIFDLSLASLPFLALAVPHSRSGLDMKLPRDTHLVAHDQLNRRLIAFDRDMKELGVFYERAIKGGLGKRASGSCTAMQSLPGLETLRSQADKYWGNGKRHEVVNDPDYPEHPANVCMDDAGATVVYNGFLKCKDIQNIASGSLEDGKVILENNKGISMSSETQVTKASSLGAGTKLTTKFGFPLIAQVTAEISITAEFTNTQGETNSVSQDQRTLQRIEQPVSDGQQCTITLKTKSCSITGKATAEMIASGFLWFKYEDRGQGHYKWGLVMEAFFPNDNDRASTVEFKVTGNTS